VVSAETVDAVTVTAPNAFVVSRIRSHYPDALLTAFRVMRPTLAKVDIVASNVVTPDVADFAGRKAECDPADARWLLEEGIPLVSLRTGRGRGGANEQLKAWLERSGNNAAGLRKILVEAERQGLDGEDFVGVVKKRTKDLMFADQKPLPMPPTLVTKRSA
jgi:hypothetical protein